MGMGSQLCTVPYIASEIFQVCVEQAKTRSGHDTQAPLRHYADVKQANREAAFRRHSASRKSGVTSPPLISRLIQLTRRSEWTEA